jgi:hypothetical protein
MILTSKEKLALVFIWLHRSNFCIRFKSMQRSGYTICTQAKQSIQNNLQNSMKNISTIHDEFLAESKQHSRSYEKFQIHWHHPSSYEKLAHSRLRVKAYQALDLSFQPQKYYICAENKQNTNPSSLSLLA